MLNVMMAKSKNIVKRKPGRPPEIDADAFLGVRLPKALLKRVDEWTKRAGAGHRSEGIRQLIERGLKAS